MKFHFLLIFLIAISVSCNNKSKCAPEDKTIASLALMSADRSFSAMCESKGMRAAFIEFIDSNGVLLRPNQLPIIGANAIDYLIQQNDTAYTLTWDPKRAEVAKSGELGFTYGIYAMRPSTQDTLFYGTYTNIWRKQGDGNWKLMLNTGNDGIE